VLERFYTNGLLAADPRTGSAAPAGGWQTRLAALWEGGARPGVAYEMCSPLIAGGSLEALDQCARTFLEYMSQFQSVPPAHA